MDQPTAMDIEELIPTKKKRFDIHSSKVATSSSKSTGTGTSTTSKANSNEKKSYVSKAAKNIQTRNAPLSSALIPSKISENQTLTNTTTSAMPSRQAVIPQPMDFTENSSETDTEVMRKEISNNVEENANNSLADASPSILNANTSRRIAHNSMPKPETSTKKYISKAADRMRGRNAPISGPSIFEIDKFDEIPKNFVKSKVSPSATDRIRGRNAPLNSSPSIFDMDNPSIFEIPKNSVKPKVSAQLSAENNVETSTKNSVKTTLTNNKVPKTTAAAPPKKYTNSLKKSFASERVKNRLEKNKSK